MDVSMHYSDMRLNTACNKDPVETISPQDFKYFTATMCASKTDGHRQD